MNYLYKLVTTENVEINYDTFKKKEFIECLATMRNIYFSLKQENQQLKIQISAREEEYKKLEDNWNKLKEYIKEEGFEVNTREYGSLDVIDKNVILEKMQELEQGDSNEI